MGGGRVFSGCSAYVICLSLNRSETAEARAAAAEARNRELEAEIARLRGWG